MSGDVWSSLCGRHRGENLTWRALTSESEAPLKQFGFRKCGNCARVEASLRRKAAAAQEGEGNERAPADTA